MSSDKYDRQTRLWGEGQYLICHSKVLVLGADCISSEFLKNLILPGIGFFTIVDDKKVTKDHIKLDFFLNSNSLDKDYAEEASRELIDLNPDTCGNFIISSVSDFINNKAELIKEYDLIVSSNNSDGINFKLTELAELYSKKLIITTNNGCISYMRVYSKYHLIMQLRLIDSPIVDLRLTDPWDELDLYFKKYNFDDELYSEILVPYSVILYHALKKWREQMGNSFSKSFPKSKDEREEFKKIILSLNKSKDLRPHFEEALNFFYYICDSQKNVRYRYFSLRF